MTPALRRAGTILLLAMASARPAEAVTMSEANAQFAAGDYGKAAGSYEELIASDGASADRLFNLGNARFRLGEHGPAILAYERAALLAPRDPDIRANLKLARKAAAAYDEPPSRPWWESAMHLCSLHEWSWITLGGAVLVGFAILAGGAAGFAPARVRRGALVASIVGLLSGAAGGFALWHRRGEAQLGIITAAEPVLRLSPFADAAPAGSPGPGRTVHLGERSSGWVYVTVPGTTLRGWLPDKDAPAIMADNL